jgi:hypothetical protein
MFQDAWLAVQREINAEAGDTLKDLPKLPSTNPMNDLRTAIQKELNPISKPIVPPVEKPVANKSNGVSPEPNADDSESAKYGTWTKS